MSGGEGRGNTGVSSRSHGPMVARAVLDLHRTVVRAVARPSLTGALQAATAARRVSGALVEAPVAGRLP